MEIDYGLTPLELKELEEDTKMAGDPEPIFMKIDNCQKVTELITAGQIKQDYLRSIFEGNTEAALEQLEEVRQGKTWLYGYEHDLIMAFWLAIHKENIEIAKTLIDWEPSLRYYVTLAIKRKKEKKPKFKVNKSKDK